MNQKHPVEIFGIDLPVDYSTSLAIRALNTQDEAEYSHTRDTALNALRFLSSLVRADSPEAGFLETYIQRLLVHTPTFVQPLPLDEVSPATRNTSPVHAALYMEDILYTVLSHLDPNDKGTHLTCLSCSRAWSAFREPAQKTLWRLPHQLNTPLRQVGFVFAHYLSSTGYRTTRGLAIHVRQLEVTPAGDLSLLTKIISITTNLSSLLIDFSGLRPVPMDHTAFNSALRQRTDTHLTSLTMRGGYPLRNLGDIKNSSQMKISLPPRVRLLGLRSWLDFSQCSLSENVRNYSLHAVTDSPLLMTDLLATMRRVGTQITTLSLTGSIVLSDNTLLVISRILPQLEALEYEHRRARQHVGVPPVPSNAAFDHIIGMQNLHILFVWSQGTLREEAILALTRSKASLEAFGLFAADISAEFLQSLLETHQSSLKWLEVSQRRQIASSESLLQTFAGCSQLLYAGVDLKVSGKKALVGLPPGGTGGEVGERLSNVCGLRFTDGVNKKFAASREVLLASQQPGSRQMFDVLACHSNWSQLL